MKNVFIMLCTLLFASQAHADKVSAIAGMSGKPGAFIGYESGEVFYCSAIGDCMKLSGTPNSPVTALGTSLSATNVLAFVGFANGNVYSCTPPNNCTKVK
jgi:hypothetical protein